LLHHEDGGQRDRALGRVPDHPDARWRHPGRKRGRARHHRAGPVAGEGQRVKRAGGGVLLAFLLSGCATMDVAVPAPMAPAARSLAPAPPSALPPPTSAPPLPPPSEVPPVTAPPQAVVPPAGPARPPVSTPPASPVRPVAPTPTSPLPSPSTPAPPQRVL